MYGLRLTIKESVNSGSSGLLGEPEGVAPVWNSLELSKEVTNLPFHKNECLKAVIRLPVQMVNSNAHG